jgi:hypothetical protein
MGLYITVNFLPSHANKRSNPFLQMFPGLHPAGATYDRPPSIELLHFRTHMVKVLPAARKPRH